MSDQGLQRIERPLTDHEIRLILWLLMHGTAPSGSHLQSQVSGLTVRERCTCGCPTVYFAYNGSPVPRKGEQLISDHLATVDGQDVGVMLFATNGTLSSLEVYCCAGSDQPFGLPEIATIRPC